MDRIDTQLQHFPDRRNTTCQPDALASIPAKQRQRSHSLVWPMLGRRGSARGRRGRSPAQRLSGTGHSRGRRVRALPKTSVPDRSPERAFSISGEASPEDGAVASGLGTSQSRPAPVLGRLTTEERFESHSNSCRLPARVWEQSKCAFSKSPPMSPGGV